MTTDAKPHRFRYRFRGTAYFDHEVTEKAVLEALNDELNSGVDALTKIPGRNDLVYTNGIAKVAHVDEDKR